MFRPKEFTTAITTWESVPWCKTDFANYGDPAVDHLTTVHNPTLGIGDICRYMGVVDGSHWRIPTAAEWAELYGSDQEDKGQSVKLGNGWIAGNYYPLSGRSFGAERNSVTIIGNGAAARVTSADPNTNGAVFLPTSGNREANIGAVYWVGHSGLYWPSTTVNLDSGFRMGFNSATVAPQNPIPRIQANAIRCIRE